MWKVYIVECADGSLYTGISNDIDRRLRMHNNGRGARYTKTRTPVRLLYYEEVGRKSDALKRERVIKKMPTPKKRELAEGPIRLK